MKKLSVNSARAIWLFNTQLLNPNGKFIVPAIAGLAERYRFAKLPDQAEFANRPLSLKFEGGCFKGVGDDLIFVNLSIHEDGLIAETRSSTDEADLFLEDALTWVAMEYGLPHFSELDFTRAYASELIVELSLPGHMFSSGFAKFLNKIQKGISNNPSLPMQFLSLSFGPDPESTKKLAPFRIERVVNTAFNKNQYFCTAPVPTSEHLELLEELENAAASQ